MNIQPNNFENTSRLYICVPFLFKDQVKALGARWDPVYKQWHISEKTKKQDIITILRLKVTVPKFIAEFDDSPIFFYEEEEEKQYKKNKLKLQLMYKNDEILQMFPDEDASKSTTLKINKSDFKF